MCQTVPNDFQFIFQIDGPWDVDIPQDVKMCAMDNVLGIQVSLRKINKVK